MRHFTAPSFWECYAELPAFIQQLATKNYQLLKANPKHPSLAFKRVCDYWSVRVGKKYRAIGTDVDEGILWFWIGSHAQYDMLISS